MVSIMPAYLEALERELSLRKEYLENEHVETIYFGGGTPSLVSVERVNQIIEHIRKIFSIAPEVEITLEANPDDLTQEYLEDLAGSPVNRLSIGIQSFDDRYLTALNRRHNARRAVESIVDARNFGFDNISIDLIYGLPEMTLNDWKATLYAVPEVEHISAYHLTIEPGTAFYRKAEVGLLSMPTEDASAQQFYQLHEFATERNMIHYEISNMGKEGRFSKHNTAYWQRKKYLGAGPSAHSYNGTTRQWNIRDVSKYIERVNNNSVFFEKEILSQADRFNEHLMVTLRTIWGTDSSDISKEFGNEYMQHFRDKAAPFVNSGHLIENNGVYRMTPSGWLISDHILSDMVVEN